MLRVLAACSAVMLGAWYLSERLLLVSSLEGVVTAPLVVLRSPINGKVRIEEAIEPAIGVRAGQALFTPIPFSSIFHNIPRWTCWQRGWFVEGAVLEALG
jgi:hypothetical protein